LAPTFLTRRLIGSITYISCNMNCIGLLENIDLDQDNARGFNKTTSAHSSRIVRDYWNLTIPDR